MKTEKILYVLVAVAFGVVLFNQYQIMSFSGQVTGEKTLFSSSKKYSNIENVEIANLKSTKHSIKALFDVGEISSQQDAVDMMIPTGTPEYSEALGGISFDTPQKSLQYLANTAYPKWKQKAQKDSAVWQRYVNLMKKPVGISCEYCCGLGATMIDKNGRIGCGCQHAPALGAVTLGLMMNTDYSDAEVLREALRWKTLFFPKNMVGNAVEVSNKDISEIELPGMVGGC